MRTGRLARLNGSRADQERSNIHQALTGSAPDDKYWVGLRGRGDPTRCKWWGADPLRAQIDADAATNSQFGGCSEDDGCYYRQVPPTPAPHPPSPFHLPHRAARPRHHRAAPTYERLTATIRRTSTRFSANLPLSRVTPFSSTHFGWTLKL